MTLSAKRTWFSKADAALTVPQPPGDKQKPPDDTQHQAHRSRSQKPLSEIDLKHASAYLEVKHTTYGMMGEVEH